MILVSVLEQPRILEVRSEAILNRIATGCSFFAGVEAGDNYTEHPDFISSEDSIVTSLDHTLLEITSVRGVLEATNNDAEALQTISIFSLISRHTFLANGHRSRSTVGRRSRSFILHRRLDLRSYFALLSLLVSLAIGTLLRTAGAERSNCNEC